MRSTSFFSDLGVGTIFWFFVLSVDTTFFVRRIFFRDFLCSASTQLFLFFSVEGFFFSSLSPGVGREYFDSTGGLEVGQDDARAGADGVYADDGRQVFLRDRTEVVRRELDPCRVG